MMDLMHTGVAHDDNPPGRGSGRHPWGSGENPGQHQRNFLTEVERWKKKGIKDAEIAKMLLGEKAKVNDLKAEITIAKNELRKINYARAVELLNKHNGNVSAVARDMGKNESYVRGILKDEMQDRRDRYTNTAEAIRKVVDEKVYVDVSKHSELYLGVPGFTKDVAIKMLEKEGYVKSYVQVPQLGTNDQKTSVIVLSPPGTTYAEVYAHRFDIKPIQDFTPDSGKTWWTPEFPTSVDSKRIFIRYGEEGGKDKDGVIELRRGVEDISLDKSQYAQVRIAVDGTHYMKGMAMYGDDIPKGYDIVYNTNKAKGTPMIGDNKDHEVLKRLKISETTGEVDRENPFGALIKMPKDRNGIISAGGQRHYIDENGKEQLSPINKLQDEGDWDTWSRNLASQFLSKQPLKLIKQQIDVTLKDKRSELEQIMNLTNPVIKKKLLEDFANSCDANAADLSVKGFKKQAFQVILPITDLKDNEIYAPNYDDGDTVALVRYPHGGIFEIPYLTVNNKHKTAQNVMRGAADAVGINAKVAEQLSGADFDGDTVCVIPVASNKISVKHSKPLDGLKNFDPKASYKLPDDAARMTNTTKQREMGIVTNLITDMTVQGATTDQIERAVRHSMVVIDAEKHHLDYKQSAKDNRVAELKKEYQGSVDGSGKSGGASTILSRASAKIYVDKFKEVTRTSDMTPEELKRWNEGKRVYRTDTKATKKMQITDPDIMTSEERIRYDAGKKVFRDTNEMKQTKLPAMYTVDDARELVRDPSNEKEMAYANYANELKAMANYARKEYRSIKPTPVNQESKRTYAKEVEELNNRLTIAEMNNPKERIAQSIGNALLAERKAANPDMDWEHERREQAMCLTKARAMVGASKERIKITDEQWDAIQANAISTDKLIRIVNNSDLDVLKQRATPKGNDTALTDAQITRILRMASSGSYTNKEIADRFGISTSTVSNALRNAS